MNWILKLAGWKPALPGPEKPKPEVTRFLARPIAPRWTPEDMDQLAAFLATTTGRKFIESLRAAHFRALVNASQSIEHAEALAHRAQGFGEAERFITFLSVRCDAQQPEAGQATTDSGAPGEAQSADGDLNDLLSRMSP